MFPTSRLRPLAGCALALLVAAGYGCSKSTDKAAKNKGESGASSAGAGATGGANDDASGGALEPAGAGSSSEDDSSYAGNNSTDGECRSGQTRCHGQLGFQRCTPEGVWGASISCGGYSDNGTSSYCGVFDDGGGPWAACVDPACWWWKQSGLDDAQEHQGVCVASDQIRLCVSGILRNPEPCAGICRRVGELDGRVLGYCDEACDDGDRECLGGALYRECKGGRWSTESVSCDGGALCQPLAESAHPDIKCGGVCELGSSRCSDDGAGVESCNDAGEWVAEAPCALGRCVQSAAQAQCQTQCKPGERACAFDGADTEQTCNDRGLWNEPSACAAGATCRVGTSGGLGCMKCVGSSVPGGNAWGVADSHCAEGVAACGADNDYAAGKPCGKGLSCVELARGAASLAYCQ